jgi:hypothetical protein
MASMASGASVFQPPFHNPSVHVATAATAAAAHGLDDPCGAASYFDLAQLDGNQLDDPLAAYFAIALAHAESTIPENDPFLYFSPQATIIPPVQTVSPTEIHGQSPFSLCHSSGLPVVDTLPTVSRESSMSQPTLSSSAYVQQQLSSNTFPPPLQQPSLAAFPATRAGPVSPERRHSLPSRQRPSLYHRDQVPRRSSCVPPTNAPMHVQAYLQHPLYRSASFSSECESSYSIAPTTLSSVSYNQSSYRRLVLTFVPGVESLTLYARLHFTHRVPAGYKPSGDYSR